MSFRLALRLSVLVACAVPALAQSPGAAVVLNRLGAHVRGNTFARKDAAYLSGGPIGSCLAPGLADGDWIFQITDPAGTVLLTPEPVAERTLRVTGGVIAQYLGTLRVGANNGPCGAFNLRLAPFATTPYPSGEYKIWLTRVEDYAPTSPLLFGFDPAKSKSDNFRVNPAGPQAILRGRTYFDENESGTWTPAANPLEVPLGGWRVELRRGGVLDGVTFTDQDGWYLFIRDADGAAYEVSERSPNGFVNDSTPGATWLATTPRAGPVAATPEYAAGPDFGNVSFEVLVGGGRTVEFWSAMHGDDIGRPILEASDPLWREALTTRNGAPVNLRNPVSNDNPNASIYAPRPLPQSFNGAFANWKAFANKTSHDHAGFMLSREVAATILNNTFGFMPGSILVDRRQDGVLVPLEEIITGAIGLLSQTGAGLTGPDDPYQDLRMMMLMCINEFGTINNTGDPSSPQIVYSRTSGPSFFESPY